MNTATREIPPLVSGPVGLSRYFYATPIMMARAATGADIIAGSDVEPPQAGPKDAHTGREGKETCSRMLEEKIQGLLKDPFEN